MKRGIPTSSSHLRRLYFLSLISLILSFFLSLPLPVLADTDQEQLEDISDTFVNNATLTSNNASSTTDRDRSFAGMIDRALEKEFTENDQTEGWLIRSDAFI